MQQYTALPYTTMPVSTADYALQLASRLQYVHSKQIWQYAKNIKSHVVEPGSLG